MFIAVLSVWFRYTKQKQFLMLHICSVPCFKSVTFVVPWC